MQRWQWHTCAQHHTLVSHLGLGVRGTKRGVSIRGHFIYLICFRHSDKSAYAAALTAEVLLSLYDTAINLAAKCETQRMYNHFLAQCDITQCTLTALYVHQSSSLQKRHAFKAKPSPMLMA